MKHINTSFILLILILCSLVDLGRSCDFPFRLDTTAGCKQASKAFTTDQTDHLQRVAKNVGSVGPPGTACDHTIERDLLQEAVNVSGACKFYTKLLRNGLLDYDMRLYYWKQVAATVNAFPNTYYLDGATLSAKERVVKNFLSGEVPEAGTLHYLQNIQTYLLDVHRDVKNVSEALDINLQTAVHNVMETVAINKISAMPKETQERKLRILEEAMRSFTKPSAISKLFAEFEDYIRRHYSISIISSKENRNIAEKTCNLSPVDLKFIHCIPPPNVCFLAGAPTMSSGPRVVY
ncbi:hypothetical protein BT96DRAFT_930877 [Gymnopus androsaceus JB14]|uniref:Uncharacterized protein n=1 Tax=Gymnopus androsaceus JB14 TaxID=1447944 RepID=A0A6A4IJY5_9AGAR|nr:hypothetical protein BT96DRAFT_930877 [Gymnopus androsaceus JB14]